MHRLLSTFVVLALPAVGVAGGTISDDPFDPPPAVDVQALPDTARVRPPMPQDERHPVEARLLVGDATAAPGEVVRIGVHLAHDPSWHTYWRDPGDIGLPTVIDWSLPPGSEQAPRVWPVPQRFEYEGIVSYGYDREVLHAFDVRLPENLTPGKVPIEAKVSWLACKEACIPGEGTVRTELVIAGERSPGVHAEVFDHWRTRWPQPHPALAVRVATCAHDDAQFALAFELSGPDGARVTRQGVSTFPAFTPIAGHPDRMIDDAVVRDDDGVVLVGMRGTRFAPIFPADDPGLGGLVQVQLDGEAVRQEIFTRLAPEPGQIDPEGPCRVFDDGPMADDDPTLPADPFAPPPQRGPPQSAAASAPLWMIGGNLVFAFLGGLLLNIMPCVLPVLALKLYGLVEQGGISHRDKRHAGLLYTAGILVSFWALAGAVLVARQVLGGGVGWGFQFQEPTYVAFLAAVVFLFGLNLFGVFEVPALGAEQTQDLQGREGPVGYFFTGVFATLVATPCSAPFLGTAIAFAFQASFPLLLAVFTFIGLGLASPFLLVAFVPAAYRLLPQPGPWMVTFKQLMGFTLIATAVWLVSVLGALIGLSRLGWFLGFLTVLAMAAWVYGTWGDVLASTRQKVRAFAGAAALTLIGGWTMIDLDVLPPDDCVPELEVPTALSYAHHIPWQTFHGDRVEALRGRTLFLDFTADWCLTCRVQEKTVLETRRVRDALASHEVVPLQADWTRRDPHITSWLERFDRAGVPMYVVIPPTGVQDAILLPEVITPNMVIEALEQAARLRPG